MSGANLYHQNAWRKICIANVVSAQICISKVSDTKMYGTNLQRQNRQHRINKIKNPKYCETNLLQFFTYKFVAFD